MTALKAEKRSMSIKAKRLRREDFVTGNIFGREIPESIPIEMERTVAERLPKTCNGGSQVLLDADGQVLDALTKDICFNSMKGLVEEIDFQAPVSGEKVHSVVEIILLNHDKMISDALQQRIQEISCEALPDAIIDKVEVDVEDMKVGGIIQVGDLDIARDKDIELATGLDTTAATVIAVHAAAETADETTPKTKQTGNIL